MYVSEGNLRFVMLRKSQHRVISTPVYCRLSIYCYQSSHYGDVIMGMIWSQITSLTIVFSIVYSNIDQRKHRSSASLAFEKGIHRGSVNSPHKWPVTRKMFPLDDVIMSNSQKTSIARPYERALQCLLWVIWWKGEREISHYSDVIMSAMASQITSVSIGCTTVCSCAGQRKHQSFASLAFMRGTTGDRWIPLTKMDDALYTLQWRHNGRDCVSNHQPRDCLLNRLFRRRSKKTPKLRVTGLSAGNSPVTGEFPAQMVSNAENVSIWWRHHDMHILDVCILGAFAGCCSFNCIQWIAGLNKSVHQKVTDGNRIAWEWIPWEPIPYLWPFVWGIKQLYYTEGDWCRALMICLSWAGARNWISTLSLSGVPDYFDRNKILSGYDLSHYQVPHCIKSFLLFCLICVYSSQFSISF